MYTAQQLVNMGYYGYQGWGDAAANADFNATGGSGKGQGGTDQSPQDKVTSSLEDTYRKLNAEYASKFTQYNSANPFRLDEILKAKRLEAKEQIDPYYNETLSDYLTGVERKIQRGTQDTKDLLSELSAQTSSYTEQSQFKLREALSSARQGFANSGLFESGSRYRGEGLLTTESGMQSEDFLRRQGLKSNIAQTELARNLEDINLGRKQDVRNLERKRFTDIETLTGQLGKEQGQKYVAGFQATLPPELQANQNFDLLKQIGIYQ